MRFLTFFLLFILLLTSASCDGFFRRREREQRERERIEHLRRELREQRQRMQEMRRSLDEQHRELDQALENDSKKLSSLSDLQQWLGESLRYPVTATENGEEGKVYLQFVVNKDGIAENVRIERSSGYPALDEEALLVIRHMPPWDGEMLEDLPADRIYRLPVSFKLE